MDIFEVELTQTVNRQEVATRLRRLAKMLSDDGDIEVDLSGMHFSVRCQTRSSSRWSLRWRATSGSSRSS